MDNSTPNMSGELHVQSADIAHGLMTVNLCKTKVNGSPTLTGLAPFRFNAALMTGAL